MQLLAARFVGLDELVFCSFDDDGETALDRAVVAAAAFRAGMTRADIVARLLAARFVWGAPDGS